VQPDEGKPRHSISLEIPIMLEMEWRGLPSSGFSTIVDLISRRKKSYAYFHTAYI
jgi:GTPase involved in cell partitioning and DNA repair